MKNSSPKTITIIVTSLVIIFFSASPPLPPTTHAADLDAIQVQVRQAVEQRQVHNQQPASQTDSVTAESASNVNPFSTQASQTSRPATIHTLASWFNGAIKLRRVNSQLYLSLWR